MTASDDPGEGPLWALDYVSDTNQKMAIYGEKGRTNLGTATTNLITNH